MKEGKWSREKEFVKKCLKENGGDNYSQFGHKFRSRYAHSMRVLKWVHRLAEDFSEADMEVVELAAIFHDVGYGAADNQTHAARGADIFSGYAKENKMEETLSAKVEVLIREHYQKEKMGEQIGEELLLLMEADLMDEEGALRIVWDSMAIGVEGVEDGKGFEAAYKRSVKFFKPGNPMVTPKAKSFWKEKEDLFQEYMRQLKQDIEMDETQ